MFHMCRANDQGMNVLRAWIDELFFPGRNFHDWVSTRRSVMHNQTQLDLVSQIQRDSRW